MFSRLMSINNHLYWLITTYTGPPIYVALTRCLARAKGGILWLVLEGKEEVSYPKWLPHDYRKLWKGDENIQPLNPDYYDDLELFEEEEECDF